jgi:hypothetical protein
MDDRKKRLLWDQLEKERRAAAALSPQSPAAARERSGTPEDIRMPGSGHLLGVVSDGPASSEDLEQTE